MFKLYFVIIKSNLRANAFKTPTRTVCKDLISNLNYVGRGYQMLLLQDQCNKFHSQF